MHWPIYKGK
uniref:Uncharacterized protein n=1 Tax=Solanum lycopersicum TaxID=4081 RepID=A0A3Q7H9G5_SOLLC